MSFLAPLFLLGGLALALPVIFHLVRRSRRERRTFSSLMFLSESLPRVNRRSRVEHWLLLALRCLVLALLAAGFARPFLKKPGAVPGTSAAARRLLVMVDTSASMRRPDLWDDARRRAESVLRGAGPADRVALFTFDRRARALMTFAEWDQAPAGDRAARASAKLAETRPGWAATALDQALLAAAEALAEAEPAAALPGQIVVVTDLQTGSRLEALQGYEWPKGISVTLEPLRAKPANNASLQLAASTPGVETASAGDVRVRLANAPDSTREQFTVGWVNPASESFAGKPVEVYVPPGQSRVIPVPPPGPEHKSDRIALRGDEVDFDNTVATVPPGTLRHTALYLGAESPQDTKQPLFFLTRAFQETALRAVQVLQRPAGQGLTGEEVRQATLVVFHGPAGEESVRLVREQVSAGGTALWIVRDQEDAAALGGLLGGGMGLEEARPGDYSLLSEIDFRHPLFAAFADPRFSDFTRIRFWRHRRVNLDTFPAARVIARFDSGDPAIAEVHFGKGRVLVFAFGWQPSDSQLALSTKFVPMLYSLVENCAGGGAPLPDHRVGDPVPLTAASGSATPLVVTTPEGSEVRLAPGETNFTATTSPGVYTVAGAESPVRFAVNLDASESQLAPFSGEELERLGVPMAAVERPVAVEAARKALLRNTELEDNQKLWRWLIFGALGIVAAETWLAARTLRRAGPSGGTA